MFVNMLLCNICDESSGMQLNDFVTAGISILTLLLNILFYILVAPSISFRFQKKEELTKTASEFLSYLSDVVSFKSYDGVPTKIRNYCLSIHLLFKEGQAPTEISNCMENIFQLAVKRKTMNDNIEIQKWETKFRTESRNLRKLLAKYTGVFK